MYTNNLKFGTTLNCFNTFMIKINFLIDGKVFSEQTKNKQDLLTHLQAAWESLQRKDIYKLLERWCKEFALQ